MTNTIFNNSKYKKIILSALVFGIFAQGTGIFNKFSAGDDVLYTFSAGETIIRGRWMLRLLALAENFIYGDIQYSSPVFNGILSLLFIGISACLIVKIIGINNDLSCILLTGILVSFPVITGLFSFMFTAHFYMMGFLLGVAGVYFFAYFNKRYINAIGLLLITASIAVYQAFLSCTITLMVLCLLKELNELENFNFWRFFCRAIYFLGGAIASLLLYLAATWLSLQIHNTQLGSYKGIGSFGLTSVSNYLARVFQAYKDFLYPVSHDQFYMYNGAIKNAYIFMLLCCIFLDAVVCYRLIRGHQLGKLVFYIALVVILPICYNLTYIMADLEYIYSLMLYGQAFSFIRFACLLEQVHIKGENADKAKFIAGQLLLLYIVIAYARYDNKYYLKTAYVQQEAISYFTTLITQIKSVDGYSDELPVAYVNSNWDGDFVKDESIFVMPEFSDINMTFYNDLSDYVDVYTWQFFMAKWCGFSPIEADKDYFETVPEVQAMPSYPNDGSIKVIEGTVVVKF